ncbi:MAG TPA: sigma-70 family RNA polymerase sigma factor [Gemmataceae bacterium]|nr:sigma-70 family RNA polymerase sigma factor [Gemmataceae bacterium]
MEAHERQAALDRAREGDSHALGVLLESFRPYVRRLVQPFQQGQVKGRIDDSDLIQDALLEVHRSFATFHGTTVAELAVWLRCIVLRTAGRSLHAHVGVARRAVRHEQGVGELAEQLADPGTSPSAQAMRHEQAARLMEALARLPADMQQVLLGRHLDGLSHAALAERLGRTEGAVRVLYVRALSLLREIWQG